MAQTSHDTYWVHLRISLALDPAKHIHLLLPTGVIDPYEFNDPELPDLVVGAGMSVLLSDWISHGMDRTTWGRIMLRGCNVIVDEGARTVADLIAMVHNYCLRYNHSHNRVVLPNDDALHDWMMPSPGRSVTAFLPDPRKPLTERYLILKETVIIDEPEA